MVSENIRHKLSNTKTIQVVLQQHIFFLLIITFSHQQNLNEKKNVIFHSIFRINYYSIHFLCKHIDKRRSVENIP